MDNVNIGQYLEKLSGNKELFCLLALIIACFYINMIIGTWKGGDPLTIQVLDRFKDLTIYLFKEMTGDVVQKINALFSIGLFFLLFGTGSCIFYDYYKKSVINKDLVIGVIVLLFAFIITMPICANYTRARYEN